MLNEIKPAFETKRPKENEWIKNVQPPHNPENIVFILNYLNRSHSKAAPSILQWSIAVVDVAIHICNCSVFVVIVVVAFLVKIGETTVRNTLISFWWIKICALCVGVNEERD